MDLIYNDFSDQKGKIKTVRGPGGNLSLPIDVNLNVDIQALVWDGHRQLHRGAESRRDAGRVRRRALSGPGNLDGFELLRAGRDARDARAAAPTGSTYGTESSACAARSDSATSGDWFLPYYLDIGAGNYSNWTWQGWAGIGYRFDWGDVVLAYRNLSYSTSGDEIVEDLRMAGPALGATFRW